MCQNRAAESSRPRSLSLQIDSEPLRALVIGDWMCGVQLVLNLVEAGRGATNSRGSVTRFMASAIRSDRFTSGVRCVDRNRVSCRLTFANGPGLIFILFFPLLVGPLGFSLKSGVRRSREYAHTLCFLRLLPAADSRSLEAAELRWGYYTRFRLCAPCASKKVSQKCFFYRALC